MDSQSQRVVTKQHKQISPEQDSAVKSILSHFANAFRWVILIAQMQSGKTDAYMFVAFELLRTQKVKKVVVIAGFNDLELVSQLKNYMPSLKLYRRYMEEVLRISIDDREDIETLISHNINVVCGSDLTKPQFQQQARDTLYIWDESHYAQNKVNRPYKFLKSVDISADGDASKLDGDRNNYFLSVSATPYSEMSDTIHEKQQKKIVKMKAGPGYKSVGNFFRAKKIIGMKKWEDHLPGCFKEQKESSTPTYSIIRFLGDEKMERGIQMAKDAGLDYEVYDEETKKRSKKNRDGSKMQSFSDLENAPERSKVIFIRGMARMGKRIPQIHMGFVMDTSKAANTDVLLQSLLGRMCGYHNNNGIKIYVGEHLLKRTRGEGKSEIERYISEMESESEDIKLMPLRACNLTGVKQTTENNWFTALPIVFSIQLESGVDRQDPDYEQYEKEKLIASIQRMASDLNGITNHNAEIKTLELYQQIMTIPLEDWNLHKIAKSTGKVNETFKEVPQLTRDTLLSDEGKKAISSLPGCGFSTNDKPILNMWYYNTDKYSDIGFSRGTLVLHGRTKSATECEIKQLEIERSIPKTSKLEAFTSHHEDGEVVLGNGAYSIHAPIDTWNVSANMQKHIENMIKVSRMELEGTVLPRCITSNQVEGSKWQGIIVSNEVLQALEKKGGIYNYFKIHYSVKLKVTKTRGKTPEQMQEMGQVRLVKIEW